MDYAKLETAALANVDDSYYYGAYCRNCKHSAQLALVKLRAHLGDGFPAGQGERPSAMRALQVAADRHHVPDAPESTDRQCRIPVQPAAPEALTEDVKAPVVLRGH
jgi:hypothetical protein